MPTFTWRVFRKNLRHGILLLLSDGPIHHAWNCPWSACQQVGFRCQHIWFGPLAPNLSCRTTNQAQLCGSAKHVSLSDFVLWQSSWWQLRCLRKCTTETHLEKSVYWWVRTPLLTVAQILGTNVRRANFHKTHPEVDLSPQGRPQSLSLETSQVCIVVLCFPHDNIASIHLCDERMKSTLLIVCRILTDRRMSGLPNRATYKVFKTICEHACEKSPTDSTCSYLKLIIIQTRIWNFV